MAGPWSIGAVIEGHVGAIFAWGILVNGSYLPGSFTYAYGFLQVRFWNICQHKSCELRSHVVLVSLKHTLLFSVVGVSTSINFDSFLLLAQKVS